MATLLESLYDVIECPICTETLKQPKSLPCLHTFCKECLQDYATKKGGKKFPCPMCRTEVVLSTGGVEQLPTNFFIQKLLDVENVSKMNILHIQCDICADDEEEANDGSQANASLSESMTAGDKKHASLHCFNCHQNLCGPCGRKHKRQNVSKDHAVNELGRPLNAEQLKQLDSSYCVHHKQEMVKMYCIDCKLLVCLVCFAEQHNTHNCTHIDKMSAEFNNRLDTDIATVSTQAEKGLGDIRSMEERLKAFMDEMSSREKEIADKCAEVKSLADKDAKKLLDSISAEKQKFQKNVENLTAEVKSHLTSLNSYTNYANELKKKGTSVDIARASNELHIRAEKLKTLEVTPSAAQLKDVTVKFTPVNTLEILGGKTKNIIGSIEAQEHKYSSAKIVIPKGTQVRGVTTIGDQLFVARNKSSDVEVYNIQTYVLARTIQVPGCFPCDMTSVLPSVLFISDFKACVVYVVNAVVGNTAQPGKWPTVDKPDGVSVYRDSATSSVSLLVTCRETRKIREFDMTGKPIREISMQGDPKSTEKFRHSWRLNLPDSYVVCHGYDSGYGFIFLDPAGKVLNKFDLASILPADSSKRVHSPSHIALDSKGNVYAADFFCNRVVRMDSTQKNGVEVVSSGSGINYPFRLHLDESHGILYVGERSDVGRIWAMKIV